MSALIELIECGPDAEVREIVLDGEVVRCGSEINRENI